MKNVKIVIGANYGDEGKGLMTDYLASQAKRSIVIRFNGGAQAAHTVQTPDGFRNVFSHIGSGTFCGADTYLSRFFLVNPVLFAEEYTKLHNILGSKLPIIYIDRVAYVTTLYDMLINQIAETVRGDSRHGSCGLGISETVVRSEYYDALSSAYGDEHPKGAIRVWDFADEKKLRHKLVYTRDVYMPYRLKQLGIEEIPEGFRHLLGDDLLDRYMEDCAFLVRESVCCNEKILYNYNNLVFEGAQGLLLDEDRIQDSPHITHSKTGVRNAHLILEELGVPYEAEVVYVTRSYMTRHGAGPFPTELDYKPFRKIEDPTNIPNTWQGSLRFGLLDVDSVASEIQKDFQIVEGYSEYSMSLAVTCLDQSNGELRIVKNGVVVAQTEDDLVKTLSRYFTEAKSVYCSFGPTRDTIQCLAMGSSSVLLKQDASQHVMEDGSVLRWHLLKTVQPFYSRVKSGAKTGELRKHDRDYRIGDYLLLVEFDPDSGSYLEYQMRRITDIVQSGEHPALSEGYVLLSMANALDTDNAVSALKHLLKLGEVSGVGKLLIDK